MAACGSLHFGSGAAALATWFSAAAGNAVHFARPSGPLISPDN